jgi:acid stress-induced BolA-like protein IbaG/YrbA
MQATEVQTLIEQAIPGVRVEALGEGCNFQLNVVSDELAALGAVKRQQAIYAVLNPLIADGSIHAVTMKFYNQAQWQAERG